MKTIYWNHTPLADRRQDIDATLVAVRGGRTYRVTLHWDTSYAYQSSGEIAVLDGAHFTTVLNLMHHDMTVFAAHDAYEPHVRGGIERAGKLSGMIREQLDKLALLGAQIIEPKDRL